MKDELTTLKEAVRELIKVTETIREHFAQVVDKAKDPIIETKYNDYTLFLNNPYMDEIKKLL